MGDEVTKNKPVHKLPAPDGDDCWLAWVVNRYTGSKFPTSPDVNPGKGLGYGEWLLG